MARYAYKRMSQPRKKKTFSLYRRTKETRARKKKKGSTAVSYFLSDDLIEFRPSIISIAGVCCASRRGFSPNNKQTSKNFSFNSTVDVQDTASVFIHVPAILFSSKLLSSIYLLCMSACRRGVELRPKCFFLFFVFFVSLEEYHNIFSQPKNTTTTTRGTICATRCTFFRFGRFERLNYFSPCCYKSSQHGGWLLFAR